MGKLSLLTTFERHECIGSIENKKRHMICIYLYTYIVAPHGRENGYYTHFAELSFLQLPIMPLSFARKLLHILLLSRYSFTLDSNGFLDPLNGLDAAPPISLATAENGITGNLVAASNTGLTGEPITDPQASNLFNSQANPDTLSQLREGNPSPCVPKTDMSPNKRRRGKREKNYCDSNLLLAPGAGKKPTGPTGSQDHESGEQQTDGSSERESGKKPSSSGQDEKQEPSADTKAGPNDNSPCNDEEFIHALCGPLSASWQIRSINAQTFRFMLGAGNICMLLDSSISPHLPLISSFTKTKRVLFQLEQALDR